MVIMWAQRLKVKDLIGGIISYLVMIYVNEEKDTVSFIDDLKI